MAKIDDIGTGVSLDDLGSGITLTDLGNDVNLHDVGDPDAEGESTYTYQKLSLSGRLAISLS